MKSITELGVIVPATGSIHCRWTHFHRARKYWRKYRNSVPSWEPDSEMHKNCIRFYKYRQLLNGKKPQPFYHKF